MAVIRESGDHRLNDLMELVGWGTGEIVADQRLDQGLAGDPASAMGGDDGVEERDARAGVTGIGLGIAEDPRPGFGFGPPIGAVEQRAGVFDEDGNGHRVAGALADAPAVLGLREAREDERATSLEGGLEREEQRTPGGVGVGQVGVAGENGGDGGGVGRSEISVRQRSQVAEKACGFDAVGGLLGSWALSNGGVVFVRHE